MPLQMLILNLDYSDFVGRLAIGRVVNGRMAPRQDVMLIRRDGVHEKSRITNLYAFEGLQRVEVQEAGPGDIVALAGFDVVHIGETVTDPVDPRPLPRVIDRRADGEHDVLREQVAVRRAGGQARHLAQHQGTARPRAADQRQHPHHARRHARTPSRSPGRGELQMAILIEMMRREGFELAVGKPEVITHEEKRQDAWSRWSTW